MRVFQGNLTGGDGRYAIVVSRHNELIASKLLEGAKDALSRHGVALRGVDVYWVPGAWELPLTVLEIALRGYYEAIVALGAVIDGDGEPFKGEASEVHRGLASVARRQRVPISLGVLVADNLEQALLRSGSKEGNKGSEAAVTAIEMVSLLRQIRSEREVDVR